jgi:hypothetical protein
VKTKLQLIDIISIMFYPYLIVFILVLFFLLGDSSDPNFLCRRSIFISCLNDLWRWKRVCPKRRHRVFRSRGNTRKKNATFTTRRKFEIKNFHHFFYISKFYWRSTAVVIRRKLGLVQAHWTRSSGAQHTAHNTALCWPRRHVQRDNVIFNPVPG